MLQAIRAVERGGFDGMILTKTKISTTAYFRNRINYKVTCSTVQLTSAGGDQGGVRLITRERPFGWWIDTMLYHGPNVVSCDIVTRLIWTPLVGAYLPLSTLEHLPDLEEALELFKDTKVLGDLNVDLDEARIPRCQ